MIKQQNDQGQWIKNRSMVLRSSNGHTARLRQNELPGQKPTNTGQTINPGQCKFRMKRGKAKIKVRKNNQNDQATKRSGSMDKKYVNGIEILK